MGHYLTFHLAGGTGGMEHFLDHFDPETGAPWTRLAAPDLAPALRDALITGSAEAAGGRSVRELAEHRDRCLVALLKALEIARGDDGAIP